MRFIWTSFFKSHAYRRAKSDERLLIEIRFALARTLRCLARPEAAGVRSWVEVTGTGVLEESRLHEALSPTRIYTLGETTLGWTLHLEGLDGSGQVVGEAEKEMDVKPGSDQHWKPDCVPEVRVSVTPQAATVQAGSTQQFSATVTGALDTQVVWTVTQPGGTMSGTGLFTASTTTGTFQVIASSVEEPSAQDTATVTVAAATTGGVAPTFVTTFLSAGASVVVETREECCGAQSSSQSEQRTATFDPYTQSFSVDTSRTWPDDPETTNVNESGFASSSSTGTQTTTFERDTATGRVLAIEGSGGGGGSASAGNTGVASASGQSFVHLEFTVGATGSPFILHATCQTTFGSNVYILLSGGGVRLDEGCGEAAPSGTIDLTLQLGPGSYQFTFERRWGAGADNNQSSSGSATGDFTVRFTR